MKKAYGNGRREPIDLTNYVHFTGRNIGSVKFYSQMHVI